MNERVRVTFELLLSRWRSDDPASIRTLFTLLADTGSPVPVDLWASASGRTGVQVESLLDESKLTFNEKGRITEVFGFSVDRMPWRLFTDRHELTACCPLIGNVVATITGKVVTLVPRYRYPGFDGSALLGREGLEKNAASGLMFSFIEIDEKELRHSIFDAFCSHIRIFSDARPAEAFVGEHPRRFLLDPVEFESFTNDLVEAAWPQ